VARSTFYNGEFKLNVGRMVGGYSHLTTVNKVEPTQAEYRIARTPIPLFSGRYTNLILQKEEVSYLFDFFSARQGTQQGFKIRNPFDYRMSAMPEGMLDFDPTTWTIGGIMEADGVNVTEIHLAKIYVSQGYATKKPIFFADGTVRLFKNGVYQQDLVIDESGAAVYVGNTSGLSIECKFFIPVWFDANQLPAVLLDRGKYKVTDIPIREKLYQQIISPLVSTSGQVTINIGVANSGLVTIGVLEFYD
jgi:uncharacterized protein (TIGR02217 family)